MTSNNNHLFSLHVISSSNSLAPHSSDNSWATSQENRHKNSSPPRPPLQAGMTSTAFYWWNKFQVHARVKGWGNRFQLLFREAENSHYKGMSLQKRNNDSHSAINIPTTSFHQSMKEPQLSFYSVYKTVSGIIIKRTYFPSLVSIYIFSGQFVSTYLWKNMCSGIYRRCHCYSSQFIPKS